MSPVLTRRPVGPEDRELLRQLVLDARPELGLLDPVLCDQMVELQLRGQEREYAAAYPDATHEVLLADGDPAGRVVVVEDEDGVRLVDLAVLGRWRRRGIATAVLRELQGRGRAVRLSVWPGNADARRLYAAMGFEDGTGDEMTWRADVAAVRG